MVDLRSYPSVRALSMGTWQDHLLFSSENVVPAVAACVSEGLAVVALVRLTGDSGQPIVLEFDPLPHTYVVPRTLEKWPPFTRATAEKIHDHANEHPLSVESSYLLMAETFDERRRLIDMADDARLKAVRPPRSIGMQLFLAALVLIGAFGLCAALLPMMDIGSQTTMRTRAISAAFMFAVAAGIARFLGYDAWQNRREELGPLLFISAIVALFVGYGINALIG